MSIKKYSILIGAFFVTGIILSSCTFLRATFLESPNTKDSKYFPSYPLSPMLYTGKWVCDNLKCDFLIDTVTFLVKENINSDFYRTNEVLEGEDSLANQADNLINLDDFFKKTETTAFLVIENGKIIYEKYYDKHQVSDAFQVFSISKSLVALTLGIAIDEGFIDSIYDSVKKYTPEIDTSLYGMRLIDLLDMRTGIKNSFILTTKLYYGNNIRSISDKVKYDEAIGSKFEYSNWATQQLMFVIEAATKQAFPEYFKEHLWDKLHPEYAGAWSLDSEKDSNARAFGGLSISARDLATVGLLMLNEGKLGDQQVISPEWIKETFTLHYYDVSAFSLKGNDYPYNMNWRIIKNREKICAIGFLGQYLYINKTDNRIIIRFGNKNGKVDWIDFMMSLRSVIKSVP
ncbi:MAG: serine hydrolase [Bacteroidales bacterium]